MIQSKIGNPHNRVSDRGSLRYQMLNKYNRNVLRDVYNICTGNEYCIYAYEPESKQQKGVQVNTSCFLGTSGHEDRKTASSE